MSERLRGPFTFWLCGAVGCGNISVMRTVRKRGLGVVFGACVVGVNLWAGVVVVRTMLEVQGAGAASANISVKDNNQVLVKDKASSTQTVTKTSVVTVKNSDANYGYTLSAKLLQNTLPSTSKVRVSSADSGLCKPAKPCEVKANAPVNIMDISGDSAAGPNGATTTWTVAITIPANTEIGNYIVDVEYYEVGKMQPYTTYGAMQSLTNANCTTTQGTAFDARNNEIYYVQKIGSLCWMKSNLKYAGGGKYDSSWGWSDDRRNMTLVTGTQTSSYTVPEYYDSGGHWDYIETAPNGGFYGYLYNWCSAMGGQTSACSSNNATQPSTATTVCPAGWRLPTGGPSGELVTLNNTMNGGSLTGDAGLLSNFLAVYAGRYNNGIGNDGVRAYMWSSTVSGVDMAYAIIHGANDVDPAAARNRLGGFTVRCVR